MPAETASLIFQVHIIPAKPKTYIYNLSYYNKISKKKRASLSRCSQMFN